MSLRLAFGIGLALVALAFMAPGLWHWFAAGREARRAADRRSPDQHPEP